MEYRYEIISDDQLCYLDLMQSAGDEPAHVAYRVEFIDPETGGAIGDRAEAVVFGTGDTGVAWGGNACWFRTMDIDEALKLYISNATD